MSLCDVVVTSQRTAALSSQRLIQSADLFFRKLKSQAKSPTNSSLRTRGAKEKKQNSVCEKVRAIATAYQMQPTERQPAL